MKCTYKRDRESRCFLYSMIRNQLFPWPLTHVNSGDLARIKTLHDCCRRKKAKISARLASSRSLPSTPALGLDGVSLFSSRGRASPIKLQIAHAERRGGARHYSFYVARMMRPWAMLRECESSLACSLVRGKRVVGGGAAAAAGYQLIKRWLD